MLRWTVAVSLVAGALLFGATPALAFDTGPHSDITRDALRAEGFTGTAADVAVVNNWFVDLYSNASKVAQSGHTSDTIKVLGLGPFRLLGVYGRREKWPKSVIDAAVGTHFDAQRWDVFDVYQANREWERLQRSTTLVLSQRPATIDRRRWLLAVIGVGLHAVQDFYSHSNWMELQGVEGVDGPDWAKVTEPGPPPGTVGTTPTWFDVSPPTREKLNVYIGDSTFHKDRPHGAWNTDGNLNMKRGVNKDWPGRLGYANAYTTAYFATRQWVRAIRTAVNDERLWAQTLAYANPLGNSLKHDLSGALRIGMMTGHWQGQGEPCDPSWSRDICGSRDGLGGSLLGSRSAVNDYFDRARTAFRKTFENLIDRFDEAQPAGALLAPTPSRDLQASTRFVRLRVTSMRSEGIVRALGDPTANDQADMFSRGTIAGQRFQSGQINGRDAFTHRPPYAPFEFIKALPSTASFGEPVTSMAIQVKTSNVNFAGTDDDVYLRLGTSLRFPLDKRLYDDFERGDRDTYSVPIDDALRSGLTVGDIKRVQIEKAPDGVGGGWRLGGVKLVVNGRTLYENGKIARWLEKDRRIWRAADFTPTSPAGPAVPITLDLWDDDSFLYGDDDHGDIEPNDRRRTLSLAYVPGAPIRDTRSTGGSRYSGRLGDGDKASLTYTIETLTPTPPAQLPPPIAPPAERPDLVITEMDWNPTDRYYLTVKNQGAVAAGPFTVAISGGLTTTVTVSGLAAGESVKRTYSENCFNVTALADATNAVVESDETNNSRQYQPVCIL